MTYGLTLQPSGIDPHIHQSSELGIALRQVYDTLIYRDPTTNAFVPGLASSWSVSDDLLSYTFNLRQDVTFHDDTPFNAQAVAINLDRITAPATASQRAALLLGTYTGYEIIDDYTIRLNLAEPYSPFLDGLSQVYLGMASPTALDAVSTNRYQFHQVGTGPFIFVDYLPDNRITLRRNPDYRWGPVFYTSVAEESVDEIVYRFFPDPATRSLAVERGDVQIMGEIQPTDARQLVDSSTVQLEPVEIPGQPLQFLINANRFPTDSVAMRQALLFGTNRTAIVDSVFQGFSPVAWGPLSRATLYYNRAVESVYAFDTTQAEALLGSLGYSDTDFDGILDLGGAPLELEMIVPPWGLTPDVAQVIQDQWRTLGIRVNIIQVPNFSALIEQVNLGEYHLVAFNSFGFDPSLMNSYYMTNGVNNFMGYSNPELDTILADATRTNDPEIRRNLYGQAQALIMREALVLPIRDYVNLNGRAASVQGLTFDSYGWFPLMHNVTLSNADGS